MFAGSAAATIADLPAASLGFEFRRLSDGQRPDPPATRFLGEPDSFARARARTGTRWTPTTPKRWAWSPPPIDDIDWDDEVRLMLEERASFSPDALTGDGGQSALRRPRDDGDAHFRAADRVAELDFPAAERGRRRRAR